MNSHTSSFRRANRGFTLVEMIIASSITIAVFGALVPYMVRALKLFYADQLQLNLNADARNFRNLVFSDALKANMFFLYSDFASRSTGSGASAADAMLTGNGAAGDCLVLISSSPDASNHGFAKASNITVYYRDVTYATGPLHRVSVPIPSSANVYVTANPLNVYQIMNTYVPVSGLATNPTIIQVTNGLVPGTGTAQCLFYGYRNSNVNNASVMIQAQVTEKGNLQTIGNIFNFTVSPRG
jgi:type II secretory pathway pseudopilin PulG